MSSVLDWVFSVMALTWEPWEPTDASSFPESRWAKLEALALAICIALLAAHSLAGLFHIGHLEELRGQESRPHRKQVVPGPLVLCAKDATSSSSFDLPRLLELVPDAAVVVGRLQF